MRISFFQRISGKKYSMFHQTKKELLDKKKTFLVNNDNNSRSLERTQ